MATASAPRAENDSSRELQSVVIRFAGDSGDGMQLTGTQFTNTSAIVGNDLATLPDYPAEIRAPAGTVAGVSGFQLQFAAREIFTPGDDLDVLVAMNPAALKRNLKDVKPRGTIVLNKGAFTERTLRLAGFEANPLEDGSLHGYNLLSVDVTALNFEALKDSGLSKADVERCKNFFVLGLLYWMYSRPVDPTLTWIDQKFKNKPALAAANALALKSGYHYGEVTEVFQNRFEVAARQGAKAGDYVNLTGNRATALGLVSAAHKMGLQLFLGSYPITPASEILHELSGFKEYGVVAFQAEDEIAAIAAAIGASFGGSLAVTTTSGPGLALKTEATGLAVMAELPLVIVNVQRGGPSTGLPTKTEQSDLLQALYARNGESPLPVLAARSPGDCYYQAIEAARIAVQYMTPVILLTDGYVGQGAEPWRIPTDAEIPDFDVQFRTEKEGFYPYSRDEATLARPWVRPGTPGLEHRIGGLEKEHIKGGVSYDPDNHELMIKMRQAKVDRVADSIPDAQVDGAPEGDVLVVGWGGTYGTLTSAVELVQAEGHKVSHMHLVHLNPMPKNVEKILRSYKKVLVCELNNGQLNKLLRERFLLETIPYNKMKGLPFKTSEIVEAIKNVLG